MTHITDIKARQILDSRGNPTVELTVFVGNITGTASVPSGASTGKHEALELRDHLKDFLGQGVTKAIKNIETKIKPLLLGTDVMLQREIDSLMIEKDKTENKSRLGANAILGVSLACAKVAAEVKGLTLYEHLNETLLLDKNPKMPRCFFNIINGGKHADNKLSFQEFMISPNFNSITKNIQAASEIYHHLKKDLHQKYGKGTTNVGDEGGFAPEKLRTTEQALTILLKAIKDAKYKPGKNKNEIGLAIDCAASEFYNKGMYKIDGKRLSQEKLLQFYLKLIKKYPIISLEDPFEQEDFSSFAQLKQWSDNPKNKKHKIQVVGDDLTVTNRKRIEEAIEKESCNCLLLKVNQIGTLTEALDVARLAYENRWKVMVSHRSGETEDPFIAELAVALGDQLKAGAPCRGERTAKYNQLLRIQELMKMDRRH